jgi:hypothetical protein
VHGASLGFNAQMYLDAGGFAALGTGEDRALHRAILAAGGYALEDEELRVITSGRRLARAPLGFAHALSSFDDEVQVQVQVHGPDGELVGRRAAPS